MICLIMMLSGINVLAESPMQMKWSSDYSDNADPKLIIEFESPAIYRQQVTVVIYPASNTNLSIADYEYIQEVTVNVNEKKKMEFSILDEFAATDGKYKVELCGNGYASGESADEITVDVIEPAEIPVLLNEFKSATPATFESVLDKVVPALQLESESDASHKAKRIGIMFSIQEKDYNGTFLTLENIRDAWNISDAIAYISDNGRTAEGIKQRIEENSTLFGIDTKTDVYEKYIDDVCEDIKNHAVEYNNATGVVSAKDVKGIVNQYIGLHLINDATEETLYNTFESYKNYFELPEAELAAYTSWNRSERDMALRSLYQKGFAKNSLLVNAFVNGVNNVINNAGVSTDPPVVIVPGGTGSGGGMSAGMTGGPSNVPSSPSTPTPLTFSDVPASHWAYPYVTKLAINGTIGGYDDGTFKPNNNVTREEFVKMVIGATGLLSDSAQCDYTDVAKDAWFYSYVASADEKGIVSGVTDTTFGVSRNITRQDVAVIATRILTYLKAEIPGFTEVTITDFDTVSDYAQESVKILNGMGIISGFDDGSFMPHNELTRAEAATIISRLIAYL